MKKLLAILLLLAMGSIAHADFSPQEVHAPAEAPDNNTGLLEKEPAWITEVRYFCQTTASRAAWGALARQAGAPKTIVNTPMGKLKVLFDAETPGTAGIPVALEFFGTDDKARDEYIMWAQLGWTDMDETMKLNPGRAPLKYSQIFAQFQFYCIVEQMKRGDPAKEK